MAELSRRCRYVLSGMSLALHLFNEVKRGEIEMMIKGGNYE
jgi:hypothetical protein